MCHFNELYFVLFFKVLKKKPKMNDIRCCFKKKRLAFKMPASAELIFYRSESEINSHSDYHRIFIISFPGRNIGSSW